MSTTRNLLAAILVTLTVNQLAAQCSGDLYELAPPPAVAGMSTTDPGFRVRYWAWDDFNQRRGGTTSPVLAGATGGVTITSLDWSEAQVCHSAGPVERTAVLLESLGPDGFGRWALVNLAASAAGSTDVDAAQLALGSVASTAVAVPAVTITAVRIGRTRVEVDLSWTLDLAGETLSDLADGDGLPLASVRGAAVFVINGPAATPRPWDWSWAADLGADAVAGFSTDARATVSLNRGDWPNQTVAFAVALTYDGDGDASGEGPSSRSVIGSWLGRPSSWVALPPAGTNRPVALVDAVAHLAGPAALHVAFTGQAEPVDVSYRVWARLPNERRVLLTTVDGGLGSYDLEVPLEWRKHPKRWSVELEMVERLGRVVDQVSVPVSPDAP